MLLLGPFASQPPPSLPQDFDDVRRKLSGSGFQVVFDINGREAVEAEPLLDALAGRSGSLEQYIYCSSAGGGRDVI
jgi:hypothetical protein